jgi:hypothetical protein
MKRLLLTLTFRRGFLRFVTREYLERMHQARSAVCFLKTSLKTGEIYRENLSRNRERDFINEKTPFNINFPTRFPSFCHARYLERMHQARSVVCFLKTSLKTGEIYREIQAEIEKEISSMKRLLLILTFRRGFLRFVTRDI